MNRVRLLFCFWLCYAAGMPANASITFTALGDLPGGNVYSRAFAVSADGTTVVGWGHSESGNEAFRWTEGGGMVGLGDLPGGRFESRVNGVSADGSTVVGYGTTESGNEASRWTEGGAMVGLGDFPGGRFFSIAYDVSADGSTIVGFGTHASGREAFRWTEGGGMVGLGDFPGGDFYSDARGISADGSTIVGYGVSRLGVEAFVWDSTNGMRSIHDLLIDEGIDMTGWRLEQANGVSADGRIITGYGTNPDGNEEAWVVNLGTGVVPEPGPFSLWGALVFGALLCQRYIRFT